MIFSQQRDGCGEGWTREWIRVKGGGSRQEAEDGHSGSSPEALSGAGKLQYLKSVELLDNPLPIIPRDLSSLLELSSGPQALIPLPSQTPPPIS